MQTELDRISNQNHLQLIKALIPHLPASNRKRFSVLIKIIEMQNVIRFYNSPHTNIRYNHFSSGNTSDGQSFEASNKYPKNTAEEPPPNLSDSPESLDLLDILTDVRCYCEGEEQQMIDQALQMMSMVELFSVMSQSEASPENDNDCDPNAPFTKSDTCDPDTPPTGSDTCDLDTPPIENSNC